MKLYPVIVAGGSGTRFWPLSRKAKPKQFLALASKKPLLVETFDRMKGLASAKDTLVVCGGHHAAAVRKLLPKVPKGNILIEPAARNTAPAIALAALEVWHREHDGILAVLWADQHIGNVAVFQEKLRQAVDIARDKHLVSIGVQPTRPETGYGYIHLGEALGSSGGFKVAAFVEKPDLARAQQYVASKQYLWNAGIFVMRADVLLDAFQTHMPELWQKLEKLKAALGTRKYAGLVKKLFPTMPSTSIDYGVMEKASDIVVVPGDFGWCDVGSFGALPEVRPQDANGNVQEGTALLIDCEQSVVLAGKRPVAVVGMKNVVVVDAGDAILVLPKDKSQDVRKVVEALKKGKLKSLL